MWAYRSKPIDIRPDFLIIDIEGGSMTKQDIINHVSQEASLSRAKAEEAVETVIRLIKEYCDEEGVPEPDIYSEFGKYTVGESGATIFSVIGKKQQNDAEQWYMLDNSLINTLPDSWGIKERFILLPPLSSMPLQFLKESVTKA